MLECKSMVRMIFRTLSVLLLVAVASCRQTKAATATAAATGYSAEGIASYYEANGSKGASGQRLQRGSLYAAHRTLPMHSKVRITNLNNGRSCTATILDRGPHRKNRLIDVSSAVADELGFRRAGLTKVKVELLSKP